MVRSILATLVLGIITAISATPLEAPPPTPWSMSTADDSQCTSTLFIPQAQFNIGPTLVSYTATETITSKVDCSGCVNVETAYRFNLGPGPVAIFTVTSTAEEASKVTQYVCSKSKHQHSPKPTATATATSTGKPWSS
jgi:hypothetical protein